MKTLNWGLIGAGDIARKRIAPALRDLPNCNFVSVNRSNFSLAGEFAKEFDARKWFASWRELIDDEEIDTSNNELPRMHTTMAEGDNQASSVQIDDDEGAEFGDLMTQASSSGGGGFALATQETIGAGTQQSKSSSGTSGMISSLSPDLLASPSPQRGCCVDVL